MNNRMHTDNPNQVDLILPQEIFSIFQQKVLNSHMPPQYKRVTMTLGQVLEKDFFQEYLKIGMWKMTQVALSVKSNCEWLTLSTFLRRHHHAF